MSYRHHATADHTFTDDETEFLGAMTAYKKATGKQFPTWTEALEVIKGLGYEKTTPSWDEEPTEC